MKPARVPGGTSAPYGQACTNCAHAKCKCILLLTGSGCERCQRLGKECRTAVTVRKRNQRTTASKFANLEAKMDLVLASYPELQGSTNPALTPNPNWETAGLLQTQPDALHRSTMHRSTMHQSRPGTTRSQPTLSPSGARDGTNCPPSEPPAYHDILTFLYVPPSMAQKYLDQFRTYSLQYFPFVYIPPDMTSDLLKAKYPFFWICIMEVLTNKNPEKGDSSRKIINHIHQRVMIDVSPSMDLLLGIITFISWATYAKKPFLNSFAHILMGVVAELGINQGVSRDKSILRDYKAAIGIKKTPTARTLEERRAVLGCYLISSSTALSMSKIDPMRWTPHMQESLSILAEAKECPEDEILLALVKIHLVLDRSYQLRRDGDVISPLSFYLGSFKSQLDAVKQEIPPHLHQHQAVLMYIYNAEITINEISLAPPAIPDLPDIERLGSLYTSLRATKSWLDIWLQIRPEEYFQLSSIVFFQFVRAVVNLYKLSVLEDPAWNKTEVRQTANVLEYLDRNIALIQSRPEYLTFEEGRELNMLEKGLRMITALKHNWEPILTELWDLDVNDGSLVEPDNMLPPVVPLIEMEEAWMMDFMGYL